MRVAPFLLLTHNVHNDTSYQVPVLVENRDVFHPTLVQSTEVFLWYKQRRFMYGVMNNTIVPPHASTMVRRSHNVVAAVL